MPVTAACVTLHSVSTRVVTIALVLLALGAAPAVAVATIAVDGETKADRRAAADLRRYLERNARGAPWFARVLAIDVDHMAITVRTTLRRSDAGRAAAKEVCAMIQGSDVADFTPGHRVVDRDRAGIRRCPPRRP